MQEKPFYVHAELHKEIVKNAWIISHEGRKILAGIGINISEKYNVDKIFEKAKRRVSRESKIYRKTGSCNLECAA